MTPNKPYLIRAIHEWIVDNGLTPYLLVNTAAPDVDVPMQFAQNGKIILNIAPAAVQGLHLANDMISFSARFGGNPREVFVPTPAVMAIYAKENGQGLMFNEKDDGEPPPTTDPTPDRTSRPSLKVVK